MKKVLAMVCITAVCGILSACARRTADVSLMATENTEVKLTATAAGTSSAVATTGTTGTKATELQRTPLDLRDIEWPVFSATEYQAERDAVRAYYKDDYDMLKKIKEDWGEEYYEDSIYIAKKDMNRDGRDEIIAYMAGILWSGSAGSSLEIMEYDGEKVMKNTYVVHVRAGVDALEAENRQIGLLRNGGNARYCYDFVFADSYYQNVWFWDDERPGWDLKYYYFETSASVHP